MPSKILVVLTGKSRERLMKEGGTSEWVLNPGVVRGFEYVICVRHGHPPYDPGPGVRPEPHGAAFLVAKISDLELTGHDKGRDRYMVKFAATANVLVPGFWDGSRNPVRYMDAGVAKARGIDVSALDYEPFEAKTSAPSPHSGTPTPLSIHSAKQGLAKTFDVPIESIEIIIKG